MRKESPIILFADPDITSCRPLRTELRRRGARVLVATSLEQAQEYAELFQPELLVLDEDLVSDEVPDPAAYFRRTLPAAEMALLRSRPSDTPRGWGLGLLYSGTKEASHELLLEAILQSFPTRLAGTAAPGSARVLCVDDDRLCLSSYSRLLTHHGYRVAAFDDPRAALHAIKEVLPDLALLDVAMPGVTGLEMTREIRREFADLIPVVLISGYPSAEGRAEGRALGASHYVAKPCDPLRLLDVVDYYAGDLDARELELLKPRLLEAR